ARFVQRRLDMPPAQRKAVPPWQTMEAMLREEGLLQPGQKPEDALIFRKGLAPGPQQSIGENYGTEPTAGMAPDGENGRLPGGAAAGYAGRDALPFGDRDGRQGALPGQEPGGVQAPARLGREIAEAEDTAAEIGRHRAGTYAANFADAEPAPEYADTPEAQDAAAMLKAHGVGRVHVVRGMKSYAVWMPDGTVFIDESLGAGSTGTALHELVHKWKREGNQKVKRIENAFQRSTAAAKRFILKLADSVESAIGNRAAAEAYADEHAAEEAAAIALDQATESGGKSALGLEKSDILAAFGGMAKQVENMARALADQAQAAKRDYLAGRAAQAAPTADATDRAYAQAVKRGDTATAQGGSRSTAPPASRDVAKLDAEYLAAVERGDTAAAQRIVDEAVKKKIDDAVQAAKRAMAEQSEEQNSIQVEWDYEDRPEENQKLWFPDPDIPRHLEAFDEFVPKDAIYEINGKYVLGESQTRYDSLEDAQSAYKSKLQEWAKDIDKSGSFGQSMSGHSVSSKIFDAFPEHPAIEEDWGDTKWGSWYLRFRDQDGAIRKISVRDHDASRKDMGIPDKTFYVEKSWTPDDVGAALIRAWKYIQDNSSDPIVRNDAGRIIPPSERFNLQNPDIRFATSSTPTSKAAQRIREQVEKGEYPDFKVEAYKMKNGMDGFKVVDWNGKAVKYGMNKPEAEEFVVRQGTEIADMVQSLVGDDPAKSQKAMDAYRSMVDLLSSATAPRGEAVKTIFRNMEDLGILKYLDAKSIGPMMRAIAKTETPLGVDRALYKADQFIRGRLMDAAGKKVMKDLDALLNKKVERVSDSGVKTAPKYWADVGPILEKARGFAEMSPEETNRRIEELNARIDRVDPMDADGQRDPTLDEVRELHLLSVFGGLKAMPDFKRAANAMKVAKKIISEGYAEFMQSEEMRRQQARDLSDAIVGEMEPSGPESGNAYVQAAQKRPFRDAMRRGVSSAFSRIAGTDIYDWMNRTRGGEAEGGTASTTFAPLEVKAQNEE
ncbi:MAG: hypothetical protein KBC05_20690, partial [Candidatus Hydrogenedentes bacterium]|nr:hypothetical protein [Candidatus Hydrogenedentota bacterium]